MPKEKISGNASGGPFSAPASLPPLSAFNTAELLDELQRRSVGCLCVLMRIEEHGGDGWHYRVKGSSILLGALSAALMVKTQRHLEGLSREGHDELSGSPAW